MLWGDKVYTAQFYNGLKDLIKDEISQEKRLMSFIAIVKKVLRIN